MAESGAHILGNFDAALQALRSEVLLMGALTDRGLRNAMAGLFNENDELCNVTIADDDEIDQLEMQVDAMGMGILMRFQPVATDFRQVVSAMKVGNNLERVADAAASIAKKSRKLSQPPAAEDRSLLEPMFKEAIALLNDSVKAFCDGDVELARSLNPRDRKLDDLNAQLAESITARISQLPDRVRDHLALIFIARHLERVGDHAKNIGEDAVYAAAAEDIRHPHLEAAG